MTDQDLVQLYAANPIDPDVGDLAYGVENTGTTPLDGAFKYSALMFNRYKITPSVASSDLTVAIKLLDGTDPSTDRPLYWKIGATIRKQTAALSVIKLDGTNWAALGSADTGGLEHRLFLYACWNTALATPAVDIFWSRIPYGRLYSDFSGTTTAYKYAAQTAGATAPNSTDECVNIGAFSATLSLVATSYLWTVPTYSNINLRHEPTFETPRTEFRPAPTGYSVVPTSTVYEYQIINRMMMIFIRELGNGTSNATTITMTLPFPSVTLTNASYQGNASGIDNTAALTTVVRMEVGSGSTTLTIVPNMSAASTWTNTGGKRVGQGFIFYPIG